MGSRSDACRCDAEGYPHPMASTGAASLGSSRKETLALARLRNSGTRALGDGRKDRGTRQLWANIYITGAAGVGHVRARFGGGLVVLWS